ncbi:MAG: YciI family protein [Ignavibacteriaceae bacterium]
MKQFLLVFRGEYGNVPKENREAFKDVAKKWQDWINKLSSERKWVAAGTQLSPEGKVVKPDGLVTDGPYTETKEVLMSYCTIKADSIEDAVELSKDCPHLIIGGSIEIRELVIY